MKLRFRWAAVALVSFLAACGVQRSGLGGVDGSRPDVARGDGGLVCPEGTVDVNGDPEDGCECAVSAAPGERCNGIDDDCDGTVDEEIGGDPRVGGSCDGEDEDLCMDGIVDCVDGTPTCVDPQDPEHVEVCDDEALDEDCDGDRNEGCSCTPGSDPLRCGPPTDDGICQFGTQTCVDGSWGACEGAVLSQTETCDNRDEDCDGRVDEGVTEACANRCGTMGLRTCMAGRFGTCDAPAEPMEVCDGNDNDCDGNTDEGVSPRPCTNACGAGGTEACIGGRYQNCTAPPVPMEICDGDDNDCDGNTDEGVMSRSCTDPDCGRAGTQMCMGASGYGTCQADDAVVEDCNNVDDDCDGTVDENLMQPCTGGCGASGTQICTAGAWGMCVTSGSGGSETCDATDEDCDGTVDEGADCGTDCTVQADPVDPTHTYIFCQTKGDWPSAQFYCADRGYHLAHIESDIEQNALWLAAQTTASGASWWIGLRYDTTDTRWEWTDGTVAYPSDPSAYNGWRPGQPGTNTNCARLEEHVGTPVWKTVDCSNTSASFFICEAGD